MGQAYDHKHVLFVDDDPASRRLVERMLDSGAPGARVTCVGDGAQALAVLDREPVDLLITDLKMPVLGGIELILQVMHRRLRISLLVVSGQKDAQEESKALAYGALAYFEKPLRVDAFISCVCNLLKNNARPAPLEVVSLAGLARIISMERKTCALRVTLADQPGLLMFVAGELVDARQAELDGLAAAQRMLAWEAPSVALEPLVRAWKRTIDISLAQLLLMSADRRGAAGVGAARPMLPEPPDFRARRTGEQPSPASLNSGASGRSAAVSPAAPAAAVRVAQVRQPGVAAPSAPSVPSVPPPPILPLRSPPMASRNVTPPAVPSPPVVKVPPRVGNVPTGSSRAPAAAPSPRPEVGQAPELSTSPAASVSAAGSELPTNPSVSVSAAGSELSTNPTVSVSAAPELPTSPSVSVSAGSELSTNPSVSVSAAAPELPASPAISESAAASELSASPAAAESAAGSGVPAPSAPPVSDDASEVPTISAEASLAEPAAALPAPADPAPGLPVPGALPPTPPAPPASAPAPRAPALAAPVEGLVSDDYFELVDRARDLLRVAEFEVAERLLLRALQVRPGDRVVQQNLRVLARRRGPEAEANH